MNKKNKTYVKPFVYDLEFDTSIVLSEDTGGSGSPGGFGKSASANTEQNSSESESFEYNPFAQ